MGAYAFVDDLMRFVVAPAGRLYFMSPAEGFFAYLKLAVIAGFMVALPAVLWQVWRFVAPALTSREKKWGLALVPGFLILFLFGVVFAYTLVWPAAVKFFLGFGNESLMPMISLGQYLSFCYRLYCRLAPFLTCRCCYWRWRNWELSVPLVWQNNEK